MSLEKRVEALEAAARPDEGWSLSDFRADVSEVIGDKRDLIKALERIGSVSEQKVLLDQVIKAQSQEVDRLIQDAQRRDEASRAFTSIMDWWDQNYRIIVDAKESLALNKQIVDAANNATTSIDASARSARQASENFERATAQKMRDFGNTFEAAKRDLANTATTASRNLADSEKKVAAAVEAAKKAATEAAAAEIRKTDGNLAEMKRIQDRVNAAVNAAAQTLTNEVKKVFVNPPEGYKTLGDVKARVEEAKKAASDARAVADAAMPKNMVSAAVTDNTAAQRYAGGRLRVGDASEPDDAVNKRQMEMIINGFNAKDADLERKIQEAKQGQQQVRQDQTINGVRFMRRGDLVFVTTVSNSVKTSDLEGINTPQWARPMADVHVHAAWVWEAYGGGRVASGGWVNIGTGGRITGSVSEYTYRGIEFSAAYIAA